MAPAFVAGRYDPLAQHGHLAVLDAFDPHHDVRRIADAFAVDENTAETLNDPDNAGAADALIVATRDTGAADTLVAAAAHLRPDGGRSGKPESHKQRPARDHGLLGHDWPPPSASPSAASSGPSL